jgi:hypothetical protein
LDLSMGELQNLENAFTTMAGGVSQTLIESMQIARAARDDVRAAKADDGMDEMHQQLVVNRAMIERLEYVTSSLGFMKTRTEQAVAQRRAEYDDAYMAAATKKSVGFADYASAKEKDAHFALGTVQETLNLRKAEATHRDVTAAWDYCRTLLRGAEGVQRDMELRIRLINLRSQLER